MPASSLVPYFPLPPPLPHPSTPHPPFNRSLRTLIQQATVSSRKQYRPENCLPLTGVPASAEDDCFISSLVLTPSRSNMYRRQSSVDPCAVSVRLCRVTRCLFDDWTVGRMQIRDSSASRSHGGHAVTTAALPSGGRRKGDKCIHHFLLSSSVQS